MQKLTFSGHESFVCKQFWLKKVYDYAADRQKFTDDNAVVVLGVGKNMVASLRFWGKAFGILNEDDTPTEFAHYIFSENGKDPYLEDIGTLWLLHYNLVSLNKASIYSMVFNEFKRERIDFTKAHLTSFIKRKCEEQTAFVYNENTISKDINVFLKSYVKPDKDSKVDIEDDFSGIFIDLNLIQDFEITVDEKKAKFYRIESTQRDDIPYEIVLYLILDRFKERTTIALHELQIEFNSPGTVLSLSPAGISNKIEEIIKNYKDIVYSETAGNQILQIKVKLKAQEILDAYYKK